MESKEIEQLLERYWEGDTSLEEEARLRDWLTQEDVPAHLRCYQGWFEYLRNEQDEHLEADFDARVLAAIEKPVVKARKMSMLARFMPLLKAAAVVALFVSLGNVMQHPFGTEELEVIVADTIGKQITVPSVALSGDTRAKPEKQLLDSLHRSVVPKEKK